MNEEIQNELNEIAPALAKLPCTNAFGVPTMYFSSLPEKIIDTVKLEEDRLTEPTLSPALLGLKKSAAMLVPDGYFAQSSSAIIQKIRAEEVKEELTALAPTLGQFAKQNPFTVPAYYFSSLPARILETVKQEEAVSSPSFGLLDNLNNLLDRLLAPLFNPRLAVAFASIFVVAVMFWFGAQNHDIPVNTQNELAAQLKNINSEDIHQYIAMNIDDFDEIAIGKKLKNNQSIFTFDESLINDQIFEQELLKELDEEFLYNNLEPV